MSLGCRLFSSHPQQLLVCWIGHLFFSRVCSSDHFKTNSYSYYRRNMLSSLRKTSIQRFNILTSKLSRHQYVLKPFSSLHIPQFQQGTKTPRATVLQQRFAYIQTRQLHDLKQESLNAEPPNLNAKILRSQTRRSEKVRILLRQWYGDVSLLWHSKLWSPSLRMSTDELLVIGIRKITSIWQCRKG